MTTLELMPQQSGVSISGSTLQASPLFPSASALQAPAAASGLVDPLQSINSWSGASSSPLDVGNGTLGTATNLGTLYGQSSITGSASPSDQFDYFRFTTTASGRLDINLNGVGGDVDLYLIYDGNSNGLVESNEYIASSAVNGNFESISFNGLPAGDYYALVYEYGNSLTNYTLTLTSDKAGTTLPEARNLGTIVSGTATVRDYVGISDPVDAYQFQLTGSNNILSVSLTGLTADADLYLVRDFNLNGLVDQGELLDYSINYNTDSEFINIQGLGAGNYFLQVVQYEGNTNYAMSVSVAPGEPGNTLSTAANLGTLAGRRTVSDRVSISDLTDVYSFNLNTTSNLQLALTGMTNDADLMLIRDSNFNGLIDPGEILQSSTLGGSSSEFITVDNLAAGNYFVAVNRFSGDTNYNLTLTSDSAGSDVWAARNLGTLSGGSYSLTDFVGQSDMLDYYRFTIGNYSNVSLNLSNLTADADLYLIRDLNGNGLTDYGEVWASSINSGALSETINLSALAPGTYYVAVAQHSGNTNYKLNLVTAPVMI
jgi:hypothetical protein